MYTITWLEGRKLFSISTPSMSTASRLFWTMRCKGRMCARLWLAKGGATMKLF